MKKISYILIANFLLFIADCYSQPVTQKKVATYPIPSSYTQFQVSIGTTQTDVAHSIVQTTDGGYAIAGYTWQGGFYAYIVKLDASGMLQWTRTLGGTGSDDISSIVQTNDGGYIAAGSSIFKLDKNGTLKWCENISGYGNSIIQTSDGGYTIAGYTNTFGAGNYDMFVVRLDSSGSLQWARTVGGIGEDFGSSIIQTLDSGYTFTGSYTVYGVGSYILVVKLNSSGTLEWAKSIGEGHEEGYSITQTTDGGYAVAGRSFELDSIGHEPFYVVKLDSTSVLEWTRTVGLRDYNVATSIVQTFDGGYALAGYTLYVEGPHDWYIVKLNSTGMLEWSRVVGGGTGLSDEAYSIFQTLDGGCAAAGVKDSFDPSGDMYIVKYDSNWHICGNIDSIVSSYSGSWGTITTVTPTVTSPTGFITARTPTIGSGGNSTMICVTGIQSISNKVPVSFKLFQNYPNPFNPTTTLRFSILPWKGAREMITRLVIYDVLGREIAVLVNEQLTPGTYEIDWDATNYPSGIYFYRLESGTFVETKKMVLLK